MSGCVIKIKNSITGEYDVIFQEGDSASDVYNTISSLKEKYIPITDVINDGFSLKNPAQIADAEKHESIVNMLKNTWNLVNSDVDLDSTVFYITDDENICKAILVDSTPRILISSSFFENGSKDTKAYQLYDVLTQALTSFGSLEERLTKLQEILPNSKYNVDIGVKLKNYIEHNQEDQDLIKKQKKREVESQYKQWIFYKKGKTSVGTVNDTFYADTNETLSYTNRATEGDIVIIDGKSYLYIGEIKQLYNNVEYGYDLEQNTVVPITIPYSKNTAQVKKLLLTPNESFNVVSIATTGKTKFEGSNSEKSQVLIKNNIINYNGENYKILKRVQDIIWISNQKNQIQKIKIDDLNIEDVWYQPVSKINKIETSFAQNLQFKGEKLQTSPLKVLILRNLTLGDRITTDGNSYYYLKTLSDNLLLVQDKLGTQYSINFNDITSIESSTVFFQNLQFSKILQSSKTNQDYDMGSYMVKSFHYSDDVSNNLKQIDATDIIRTNDGLYYVLYKRGNSIYGIDSQNNFLDLTDIISSDIESVYTLDPIKRLNTSKSFKQNTNISLSEYESAFFDYLAHELGIPVEFVEETDGKFKDKLAWTDNKSIYINVAAHKNGESFLESGIHEFTHILLAYVRMRDPEVYRALIELKRRDSNQGIYTDIEESIVDHVTNIVTNAANREANQGKIDNIMNLISFEFKKLFNFKTNNNNNNWLYNNNLKGLLQNYNNGVVNLFIQGLQAGLNLESLARATAMQQKMNEIKREC